jgi:NADPH:quinone reductase-like Zn-dependent oxidoreductase
MAVKSKTNTALVVQAPGLAVAQTCSVPVLRDDYVLVNVKAVALNPTDWKHIDQWTTAGARNGCGIFWSFILCAHC